MSSPRSMRRATGQLRRLDESSLEHGVRRSRRVAGESPESGPYYPPPRRPSRQDPAYQNLAQSETPSHPSPPSSTFTFSRPDPSVPDPGFSPVRPLFPQVPTGPTQTSHVHHLSDTAMTDLHPPRRASPSDVPSQGLQNLPAPVKTEKPVQPVIKTECDMCCDAGDSPVLQPCRLCAASYCGHCIRVMFLEATHDSILMPPKCCAILSTIVALDFLSTTEADEYRLKFEEWVSIKKTYCPVPECSRFIPDRAVLPPPPPPGDSSNLWSLVKQELPGVISRLKQAHCARLFRAPTDLAAHRVRDWKPSKKMVWLNDISAKLPRYVDMDEFTYDFNRLVSNARAQPVNHLVATDAEELRKLLWREIGNIKDQLKSNYTSLPAGACFSCPGCHIGICPSCKQIAHFGQPCDTSAKDHELAMLKTYGYKKCPRCGHGVKRMYGCRHMQCRCGAHWCWGCLLPIEECDGGCTAPTSESEDGYFSDEELDPDITQANFPVQEAQSGGENIPATAPTAANVPRPGNVPAPANGNTAIPSEAAGLQSSAERPVNLDAGGHRVWEGAGANFGDEPEDHSHDPIWACEHDFNPAQLREEAFQRGVPLGNECFRCFSKIFATVQKAVSGSSKGSQVSGEDEHRQTADKDMAWQCSNCAMLLCVVCKDEVLRE